MTKVLTANLHIFLKNQVYTSSHSQINLIETSVQILEWEHH